MDDETDALKATRWRFCVQFARVGSASSSFSGVVVPNLKRRFSDDIVGRRCQPWAGPGSCSSPVPTSETETKCNAPVATAPRTYPATSTSFPTFDPPVPESSPNSKSSPTPHTYTFCFHHLE